MKLSQLLRIASLVVGPALIVNTAFAQFPLPKFPGMSKHKDDSRNRNKGEDGAAPSTAQGIPIPADSPIFQSFNRLDEQPVYRQRISMSASDPQMEQMMAMAGFSPAETTTAGDLKQVSMHMKMPIHGQQEDFELRTVVRNGRFAKKWISPASTRILAEADANIAKQLAQSEEGLAKSIVKNIAMGPAGLASSAVSAAAAAANVAAAGRIRKQAHDFFEWTCGDGGPSTSRSQRPEPPPLTDLKPLGDQTLDGVSVTGFEFFVKQDGRFQGPIQMFIAKDSGLPMRIAMNDPRARGGMHMDYYGFSQTADIEIPACMAEQK